MDYISHMLTMLEDKSTYLKLSSNKELTGLLQEGITLGVLSQKEVNFIYIKNPKYQYYMAYLRFTRGLPHPL